MTGMTSVIAQVTAAGDRKSLLEYVRAGGGIGYFIILLSLVAVGLFITQLIRLQRSRLSPEHVQAHLGNLLERHDVQGAMQFCRDETNACFLTRVFGAALSRCCRSAFGFLELKSALEEAGQQEVARLYRATDGIGLIAAVAPMVGLLGTVVGMVGAFDTISTTEGVAKPGQLAGDISIALVTTVQGLVVAIPATAAFAWLRNRIDSVVAEIGETVDELASRLEGASKPAAAPPAGARGRPTPQPTPPSGPRA
ncbi:MAG: MotA/TolQ/ExbB proton channel family protein [Phycisphaeraceae bacterium]|nr:MotA/TolQ/ExbB proton channel family protein [Phycisphaeraceae bacterium]